MESPQVAERQLIDEATGASISVTVAQPQYEAEGGWSCRVAIREGDRAEELSAYGEDSLQALLLAVSMLRAHLTAGQRVRRLTWLGDPDLGLDLVL